MADYSLRELEEWNSRIEEIARSRGLDFYEQEFEIVNFEDMICYEAYTGMPSHYPHWSYGKAYERIKTLNRYNLTGIPYEMVINSNPCIAYLMKDNTLLLQILTIAHVYGHNDFFKNNRLFRSGTRSEQAVELFKNHADRVREYIAHPGIGYAKVEKILNAAHAIRYQTTRIPGEKKKSEEERRKDIIERMQKPRSEYPLLEPAGRVDEPMPELKKIPPEPEEDLLYFISRHGKLEEWEKDILEIVREETMYFIPQIETKIMNEGWASYWHYEILNELKLPQGLHMEFLKRHNQVIRPMEGQLNPYYVGFKIFQDLARRYPDQPDKIFGVRQLERDESFIRRYLTQELCREMNLFEYRKMDSDYVISEISDEEGWKKIRDTIAMSAGMGSIPLIRVDEWDKRDNLLIMEHVYDGRELELTYANATLKHLVDLWDGPVMLHTVLDGKRKAILCDADKKITMKNG